VTSNWSFILQPKATNTVSQFVILSTFPLQLFLLECAPLLRHTYITCLIAYIHRWKACRIAKRYLQTMTIKWASLWYNLWWI